MVPCQVDTSHLLKSERTHRTEGFRSFGHVHVSLKTVDEITYFVVSSESEVSTFDVPQMYQNIPISVSAVGLHFKCYVDYRFSF